MQSSYVILGTNSPFQGQHQSVASTSTAPPPAPPPLSVWSSYSAAVSSTTTTNVQNPGAEGPPPTKRRKLAKEAEDLRLQYAIRYNNNPTLEQRRELLALIQAVPECKWYEMPSLSSWFSMRRNSRYQSKKTTENCRVNLVSGMSWAAIHVLCPSFSPQTAPRVEVLLFSNDRPSVVIIDLWARQLNVSMMDLNAYITSYMDARSRSASPVVRRRGTTPGPPTVSDQHPVNVDRPASLPVLPLNESSNTSPPRHGGRLVPDSPVKEESQEDVKQDMEEVDELEEDNAGDADMNMSVDDHSDDDIPLARRYSHNDGTASDHAREASGSSRRTTQLPTPSVSPGARGTSVDIRGSPSLNARLDPLFLPDPDSDNDSGGGTPVMKMEGTESPGFQETSPMISPRLPTPISPVTVHRGLGLQPPTSAPVWPPLLTQPFGVPTPSQRPTSRPPTNMPQYDSALSTLPPPETWSLKTQDVMSTSSACTLPTPTSPIRPVAGFSHMPSTSTAAPLQGAPPAPFLFGPLDHLPPLRRFTTIPQFPSPRDLVLTPEWELFKQGAARMQPRSEGVPPRMDRATFHAIMQPFDAWLESATLRFAKGGFGTP